ELKALTEAERTAALNFGMLTILQSPGLSDRHEYVLESEEDSLSQGDAQSRALQVCLRAAKNTWNDLSDIYAFSAIVSHWPHDAWDKFYADARSTGYNYQVGYTIQLAHTFFGTKKPTHFVESFLSSKVAVAIFHQLLASLANPDDRIDQKLVAGGG
ncbi:MAG: hypothetical protein KDD62_12510, partial [Bdellovibrionales bacterium]|nr:hypothetical protein [Bdellovibrionales bacterium]